MLTPRYFELILYKTYADLRAEAARTYIGFLWWIIDPVIFMVTFYVVFGVLLGQGTDDYVSFLLIGLVSWRWFQNSVMHGATTILGGQGLMRQVYIPKIIFPLVTILTDLVKFILVFVLLLIYLWIEGYSIGLAYAALPLLLVVQFSLITAITCFAAALVPFVPDLRFFIEHILHMMIFVSGIFFADSSIPEKYHFYFYLNPMANIIDAYRDILMRGQWPNVWTLMIIGIISVIGLIGSYRLLARHDQTYPKLAAQ